MRHKTRSIALLSMLALLVAGATASAASAAIQFEWKVKGSPLAEGSTKPVTMKDKGTGLFHLEVRFSGAAVKLSSSRLKLSTGEGYGADIRGGEPGTGEGSLELEGVKVENLAKCKVKEEKIRTIGLTPEIVEEAFAGKGKGNAELLYKPKSGSTVAAFSLENKGGETCALNGQSFQVAGNFLAAFGSQKTEATVGQLTFEAKSKEYTNAKGEFKTAGLEYAGNPAPLTGEAEMELASKEVFGAF